MNSQIIRIAENGHEFFLQYPKAVAELKITVNGKNVADTFHFVHESIQKERNEHETAAADRKDTKARLRVLEKSLRHTAYALERGVNAVLDLSNRADEEVDFVPGTDFALAIEDFLVQLTKFKGIIEANPAYATSFKQFKEEFNEYKTSAGSIGEAKIVADTEKQEFVDTVDAYEAIIAALHALIRRFLSKTDHELYVEYKKGLSYKSSKPSESVPQAGEAV